MENSTRSEKPHKFSATSSAEFREWQEVLLSQTLNILFIAAFPALVVASYYVLQDNRGWLIPFYAVGFVVVGVMRFWKSAPYALKTGVLLAMVYLLALLSLVRGGLSSNVRIFLIGFSFVATLFLGRRAAFASLFVTLGTMVIGAWIFSSGEATIDTSIQIIADKPAAWLSYTMTLLMVSVFFVASQNYLVIRLAEALAESRELARIHEADRIRAQRDAEQKHHHAGMLAWAARFGMTLASLHERNNLVRRVVHEVVETFDVCQVNLFLMNRIGGALTLAATAGEANAGPATAGDEIVISSRLLPGRAAQIGREQVLALSGDNPDFPPSSRLEISLPLSVRGQILGVLDIHSAQSAFDEDTLQLFHIVASYVSSALDMVQLLEETETQMQEMRALYAQHTLASWRTLVQTGEVRAFATGVTDEQAVTALAAEAMQAMASRSKKLDGTDTYLLVVPLIARDFALGYLAFTRSMDKGNWTAEDRTLIDSAASRLAMTLDNTRLLMEAQRQALYDERLGQLADLIWQTPDAERIMEQSVRELGRFLGASDVQITLVPVPRTRRTAQPLPSSSSREV